MKANLFCLLLLVAPVSSMAGDKVLSLEDAVAQGQETMIYLSTAMKFSIKSMQAMTELVSEEQSEQRKALSASLAELEQKRESDDLDSKTIKGITESGEALRELQFEATQDKEQTKKVTRKANLYSSVVVAMDAVAIESVRRDLELLQKVIKKNSGFKALKNPGTVRYVKKAKDQVEVFKAFTEALPEQKDNFMFVRNTCKRIADEQNFTLMAEINPADVTSVDAANAIAESEDIN